MPGPITSPALIRSINTLPKVFSPATNPVIFALLQAMALSDDDVENSIAIARADLFVRTATGQELNNLASSRGVQRPATLGINDQDFQNLIPNLSLKPKTIRKAFYDTSDVFWGPLFSRINVQTINFAPFNISPGDVFSLAIDNNPEQDVTVLAGTIATPGAATAEEIVNIFGRFKGVTAEVITDSTTGNEYVNVRTNTPGPAGKVQVISCTGFGSSKLNFAIGTFTILNLSQRVAIYNLTENELLIEIPAVVPALRRTLRGSHHFHADATLAGPVPPANGIWQGSFLFNPNGSVDTKTISSQRATLGAPLTKGQVYTSMLVNFVQPFVNQTGSIIFDYGTENEEGPVLYRGVPNSTSILIDPGYVFKHDHSTGSYVNVVVANQQYTPNTNGKDLAIYLTSPSDARAEVQTILDTLKAAGIVLNFVVLAPKYKYIKDNPYLPEIEPVES